MIVDAGRLARRRQFIHGLLEVDITGTHERIRRRRRRTGRPLSVTAYVIYCLAQAVGRDPAVQAMRDWRGRLVIFEDVDVYTLIASAGLSSAAPAWCGSIPARWNFPPWACSAAAAAGASTVPTTRWQ